MRGVCDVGFFCTRFSFFAAYRYGVSFSVTGACVLVHKVDLYLTGAGKVRGRKFILLFSAFPACICPFHPHKYPRPKKRNGRCTQTARVCRT